MYDTISLSTDAIILEASHFLKGGRNFGQPALPFLGKHCFAGRGGGGGNIERLCVCTYLYTTAHSLAAGELTGKFLNGKLINFPSQKAGIKYES